MLHLIQIKRLCNATIVCMPSQISRGYSVCVAWPLHLVGLDDSFVRLSTRGLEARIQWHIPLTGLKQSPSFTHFLSFRHHFLLTLALRLFLSFLCIPHTHTPVLRFRPDLIWLAVEKQMAPNLSPSTHLLFRPFVFLISLCQCVPFCFLSANNTQIDSYITWEIIFCVTVFNQPFLS